MTTDYDSLKEREIEILRLMSDNLTNREIAERLYIGVETVRWYAKQIYSKLAVSGREEAADKAAQLGLFERSTEMQQATVALQNLPTPLTSFIGREQQLADVQALLAESRLLTLTGPGGTGKTRLALKVAERLLDDYARNVSFVDLAPLSDPSLVANEIANVLGIIEYSDMTMGQCLLEVIGQRKLLLILDNYEQVIDAAQVVADLLGGCPNLTILVTSREPLRVSGEQVYPVPPLALPDESAALSEAVILFVQRSQSLKPSFQLDESNRATVVAICQHLDGMPLAIELAAALSRFLTPETILTRMTQRFDTLNSGTRDAPARQQTLRNTIDWSYNLLQDGERILFARLAVFRGGRSLEAIEAVCGADLPINVFDGLAALVDKSMVRQVEDAHGEPRFVMLETIQAYALECLGKRGELEIMRHRHAQYFADLAAYARPFLRKTGYDYWYLKLTIKLDNFRAALQWSLLDGGDPLPGLRIVAELPDFWFYEGYHLEGQRWSSHALEYLNDIEPDLQVGILHTASQMAYGQQRLAESSALLERALTIARAAGNERGMAWALIFLGQHASDGAGGALAGYQRALALIEEGLTLARRLGADDVLSQGLNSLGNTHKAQGQLELAEQAYQECLAVCYRTGERRRVGMTFGNLSVVMSEAGDFEKGYDYLQQALQIFQETRFTYMLLSTLGNSAPRILVNLGYAKQAARLLGANAVLQAAHNIRNQPNDLPFAQRAQAAVRQQLSDEAFQAAYDAGRQLSIDEALALALRPLD